MSDVETCTVTVRVHARWWWPLARPVVLALLWLRWNRAAVALACRSLRVIA